MASEFVVYIDESGDEGFTFDENGGGSTRWFVLSAVVVRRTNDGKIVSCMKDVRSVLGKEATCPLHFRKLPHEQRIPYVKRIGNLPVKIINVLVHKPSIENPGFLQNETDGLYRYMTRYLIERVSWICRDEKAAQGDAEIIFSDRACMSYDKIRSYLDLLVKRSAVPSARVSIWVGALKNANIVSVEHRRMAGLQIADAVATSAFYAVNPNRFGETERAYVTYLVPVLYRYKKKALNYGMKVMNHDTQKIAPEINYLQSL